MEQLKKLILNINKSLKNIVDKDVRSNRIRLGIWAGFLIIVGGVAAYLLPEHSVSAFFDLLKTIITSLLL